MSPSHDKVLSRRHVVLVLLRIAAAAMVIYATLRIIGYTVMAVWGLIYRNPFELPSYEIVDSIAIFGVPGVVLAVISRRLARWLVPPGVRGDECPHCGYSLKHLKSPICPECGADVRGVTRTGGV